MYSVSNDRIHHTKCEMLVSLVPGGSLSPVAVCQVSHKLASMRDTCVTPSKGRIMKEARHSEKKGVARITEVDECRWLISGGRSTRSSLRNRRSQGASAVAINALFATDILQTKVLNKYYHPASR